MHRDEMHQDAHHHVRELELRLAGIVSGDRAWSARRFGTDEVTKDHGPPTGAVSHGGAAVRESGAPAFDRDLPAPATVPATRGGIGRVLAIVLLTAAVGAYGGFLFYRTEAATTQAAAAAQSAADVRLLIDEQVNPAIERTERALGEALTSAADAHRMVTVIAAPDARQLPLVGRSGAPAAAGQAMWSRSRGILLTAVHLPPPPAGAVYQIWLDTSQGPLSLGFAAPDGQGRLAVTFEMPPQLPGTIRGFIITRETAGGSTAPRGAVVLSS